MRPIPIWASALLGLALLGGRAAAQETQAPTAKGAPSLDELLKRGLNQETFAPWREFLLPRPDELGWLSIQWRLTLREGLAEARRTGKPVLLWVMNRHPFACT